MRFYSTLLSLISAVITLFFFLSTVSQAEDQGGCLKPGWPSERSDLQPDPALTRGTLDNGLRYVVLENQEPRDRVALFLYVHGGSLHETSAQRGVAHYLEHMLFNGTVHFPAGELVKFFQDIGMSFGGDTNAHTSYDETVYRIVLPKGTEEYLRKGFLVLADFARGALLAEAEVDRERGVILAEKRSRDSAQYRAMVAANGFRYKGTLLPDREVIGVESVLEHADAQVLRDYYDSWYRPENMLLVVVGDIDGASAASLLAEMFSQLKSEGEMAACPDIGTVDHSGLEIFHHHEPELGRTTVAIESVWNTVPTDDSRQLQTEELYRYASMMILNNRLKKLQEENGEVFTGAHYSSGDMLDRIRSSVIMAGTSAEKWSETLGQLDYLHRQALTFGVVAEEVDRVRKDILAALDTAVLTAGSRESEQLGREIYRQFSDNRVFLSPVQERELYGQMLTDMGVADITDRLRRDWPEGNRIVSVVGDAVFGGDSPHSVIEDTYRRHTARQVTAYAEKHTGTFPYLVIPDTPLPGGGVQQAFPAIDAVRYQLDNQVTVVLKRTDFEPSTVRVVVDVGRGKLSEPVPGLALLAEEVVNSSGTGRLPQSVLAEQLAGTTVDVRFGVGEESFRYTGKAVTAEAELLLQLIYHLLQDPGLREQAYVRTMNGLKQMYDSLARDVQGAVKTRVEPFLAGGDLRVGLPPWEQVAGLQLEQVRQWLAPNLATGSMEVAIVGDFDPAVMQALVERYFGAFNKRQAAQAESSTLTFPAGQRLDTTVTTSVAKSLVVAAWPTAGFWDIHRTRRLYILAEVLQERLRLVIREKLGASYAPAVAHLPSRVYGDYGRLQVQVLVEPGREEEILEEIGRIAEGLRADTISTEELERAKGPVLTQLKDAVRTNEYWLYSVLAGSMRHPQQLDWPHSMQTDFAAITAPEIDSLADRYLLDATEAKAVVRPAATP